VLVDAGVELSAGAAEGEPEGEVVWAVGEDLEPDFCWEVRHCDG